MKKPTFYRFVSAALIICVASHGLLIAKPADVSGQEDNARLQPCAFSDTAALFLSLQNCPKTRGAASALDGCPPLGSHGHGPWNTFHSHALNFGPHANSLCEAASPETLYALHCQFTL